MDISALDAVSSSAPGKDTSLSGAAGRDNNALGDASDPFKAQMQLTNSEMNRLNAQQQAEVRTLMRQSENQSLMQFLQNMTLQTEVSIANREAEAQLKRLTGKFELIKTMLEKLS